MFATRIPRKSASRQDPNVIVHTPNNGRIPLGTATVSARRMLAYERLERRRRRCRSRASWCWPGACGPAVVRGSQGRRAGVAGHRRGSRAQPGGRGSDRPALRSPAVLRALERAIESHDVTEAWRSDEIAQLVNRLLASDAAGQAWAQFLESEQAQMLVERIAGAPEIRAAIASQSAGLITDIGVRLTIITEEFDDALERLVRPIRTPRPTRPGSPRDRWRPVSTWRCCSPYSLISSVLASLVSAIFGQPCLSGGDHPESARRAGGGGFFAAFWALAGQTRDAVPVHPPDAPRLAEITFGCAVRRVLALILALLPLGLGYLAILRDPRRRGWHDRMTGLR